MPLRVRIACCRAVSHLSDSWEQPPYSCLRLVGRQYAWQGKMKCHARTATHLSPCHYQHLERVNKPQVSRHTTGRQSVHPAETSCRPCCVQVIALPPAASPHLWSLASCFSFTRVVTEHLLFSLILWCVWTLSVSCPCCKYSDKQSSKLPPNSGGDMVCLHWHTVRAINSLHK